MNAIKYILFSISIFLGLLIATTTYAATTFPINGGTGSTTLTGILLGNGTSPVNSLSLGTGLSLIGTTLSSTGGSSFAYPFPGNATTTLLNFNGNASTTQLTVSGNSYLADNVGIGTTTLLAALTVTNNSTLDGYLINTGTSGSGGGAGMSGLTAFLPSNGDRLAFLTGGYWNGSSAMNSTAIQSVATQNWTAGSAEGTALNFQVTPNGTASRATALTIDQGGFIGIGTTTPGSLLAVQGTGLFAGNLSATGITATSSLTLPFLTGTQCLHEIAGVVSGTGSDCGSGGGGTNYFTNSGNNTYLNTGSNLEAPFFTATSTTATSTFSGDVVIGGNSSVLPNPDLRIGTSSVPLYGRVLGDLIDAEYDYNGVSSINVANANIGTCAASTYFADGNNPALGGYYGTFSFLNDGWTDGAGAGCGIGVSTTDKPEAVAIASPTGEMDFDIASTTSTGAANFNWNVNNATKMVLSNSGNLSILNGTATVQSTSATALAVGANGATNPVLQVDASTASVATGISIKGAATGGATTITAIDSSANSSITMVPKGTGILTLQGGTGGTGVAVQSSAGTSKMSVFSTGIGFVSPAVVSTQTGVTYAFTGNTATAMSAGVELTGFDINLGQTKQHATGALFQNRDMIFIPSTQSFVGASTLTNAVAVSISGEPAAGTNATITNSMGLQIATTTLTSGVTNGIGLAVSAPTGSTNSYAASTTGRLVMNALTSSASLQSGILCLSSTNEVINESVACLASARRYKEQITDFAPQTALDQILALNPVNYIYKPDFNGALQSNPNYSREQLGLIADDVIKVNPAFGLVETATTTFEGKTYAPGTAAAVDYNEVDAALVGAVQAQQKEIVALQVAAVKDVQDGWQDGFIVFLLIAVGYLYLEVRKLKRV